MVVKLLKITSSFVEIVKKQIKDHLKNCIYFAWYMSVAVMIAIKAFA
jgi:hypothetical protein